MTGGNKKIRHSSNGTGAYRSEAGPADPGTEGNQEDQLQACEPKIIASLARPAPARPAPDARPTRRRAAVHMPRWHRFFGTHGPFRQLVTGAGSNQRKLSRRFTDRLRYLLCT